jgi:DNA-binding GntR family transcriptional regulator
MTAVVPSPDTPLRAPARRPQLKDEAAAAICRLILAGEARGGTLLRLAPVAAQLQMSVTPVREALLILAQEGWVVQEPNVGFRVAPLRRSEVEDMFLVRRFIAGELTARAALRLTYDRLNELAAIDRELGSIPLTDGGRIVQLNDRLHRVIDEAADSPRLSYMRGASRLSVPNMADVDGWPEHTKTSHAPVLDALRRRDVEAARACGSEHYRDGAALILRHWDGLGLWADDDGGPSVPVESPLTSVFGSHAV